MKCTFLAVVAFLLHPVLADSQTLYGHLHKFSTFSRITFVEPKPGTVLVTHRRDRLTFSSHYHMVLDPVVAGPNVVSHPVIAPDAIAVQLQQDSSIRQYESGTTKIVDIFPPVREDVIARAPISVISPTPRGSAALIPDLPPAFGAAIENARSGRPLKSMPPPVSSYPDGNAAYSQKSTIGPSGQPANNERAPPSSSTESIAASSQPAAANSRAMLLPFSTDVGVAAIRRLHSLIAYFDEPRPLDLSAFRADPTFAHATVLMQATYTELVLPIESDRTLELSRTPDGWRLTVGGLPPTVRAIHVETSEGEIHFLLAAPGRVLTVPDPTSGTTLLIGTDRQASNAFVPARRSATFVAEHSEVGVVVEPLSDRLSLRPIKGGFALCNDDGSALPFADRLHRQGSGEIVSGLTRSSDLPKGTNEELINLLHRQLLAAAEAPPRSRLAPRLSAAQTMIALGMEREARTLLRVAFADDPVAQTDPTARWLKALADTLTDPDHERADRLDDRSLPSTEETHLWRALTSRSTSPADIDLAAIRRDLPLLLAYPDPLRNIAAGMAAPLLLARGGTANLDALARLPATSQTVVAQAVAISDRERPADALSRLDALAKDRDMKTSGDAILQGAFLRLRLKQTGASAAAETLSVHRLDWRATGQEGDVIMQEAELRRQAGQLTKAFQLWRETERRFPDLADRARSKIVESLVRLTDPKVAATVSPADLVLVIEDCARELAVHDGVAAQLAPVLADRLEALDLPARATGVLKQVLDASAPGTAKAMIGAKLAAILLEQDDTLGARNALDGSASSGLAPAVNRDRRLLLARILERQGDHVAALTALGDADDDDTRDLKATIFVAAGRWHEAKLILDAQFRRLPGDGILKPEQGDVALRLAAAASRDGDTNLLFGIAHVVNGRFSTPDQQQTLDLIMAPLTQQPPAARVLTGTG